MTRQTGASPEEVRFHSLRDQGLSREKAERIVTAGDEAEVIVTDPESYEDWTDDEIYAQAGALGIEDRYGMGRDELIAAIRNATASP